MHLCFSCKALADDASPGRTDTCPNCGADLHCCRNCRFYESGGSYNQCRESQAERVVSKERSNFCDFFSFSDQGAAAAAGPAAKRNPLDALFKK